MMKEADYTCACGNTQTIRLFPDEPVPVVLNCTACRLGIGMDYASQVAQQAGMLCKRVRNVHDDERRTRSVANDRALAAARA